MISLVARMVRADKHSVVPTEDERKKLGEALREMALRRASWMGAFDDILAVAFHGGSFVRRALTEQPKAALT